MSQQSKLKIGLVFDDSLDKPDGVQQYVLGIGAWLSSQGHEVHYLVGQTARQDVPHIHSLSRNLRVSFNGNRLSIPLPASRRRLKALLDREQYDVLHIQTPYSPWLAHRLILAAGPRTAIFGTFHIVAYSKLVHFATRGLAWWTRRSSRHFDTLFSVSTAAQAYAMATYGLPSTVLSNVVDYQRFHAASPRQPRPVGLRILFLGRLVPRKGCQVLLAAIAELVATRPALLPFTVMICGKGPLMSSLKEYVRTSGIVDLVEFVGFVSEADKPSYYASADIAVFPSSGGESFGIVLIEAMASGHSAVLAGDNSGYRSVMGDRPELIFDSKNVHGLAVKLETYLTDTPLRQAAADWGEKYSQQFDTTVVGTQLVAAYKLALQKRRTR
ncbi:MAG: glycosyltransferase family 4 protein [Candidatus Saccharibacteria bacterium]